MLGEEVGELRDRDVAKVSAVLLEEAGCGGGLVGRVGSCETL